MNSQKAFLYSFPRKNLFLPIICLLITHGIVFFAQESVFSKPQGTQKPYIINNKKYYPIPSAQGFSQKGTASWYGKGFHGKKTSNGETYDMYAPTAAHKVLPMNTVLLVQNLENGKETVVRINDRGPFVYGRIIDLSYIAAQKLDILHRGTAKVKITALGQMKSTSDGQKMVTQYNFDQGEYYVQIGSFLNQNNAVKLQKRFTNAGHTAIIQKLYTPTQLYFRVKVYVGKTLKDARRAEQALHDAGYNGAFVIAR